MPCNSCQNLGTPGQYVARAKRLAREGHPGARKAALEAAVAVKAVELAQRGDKHNAARAIKALRALRGLGVPASGTRELTAAQKQQVQAKAQETVTRHFATAQGALRLGLSIASIVAAVISMIVNAALSGEPPTSNTRRDFNRVMGWIQSVLSGGGRLPPLDDADFVAFAQFCSVWQSIGGLVEPALDAVRAGVDAAESAAALSGRPSSIPPETTALILVGQFVIRTLNGWCGDPTIQSILNPPPAPPAPPTPPSLETQVSRAYQTAKGSRALVEISLRLAGPVGDRARAADCSSSDALVLAERAYIDLFGRPPPDSSTVPNQPSMSPRRYLAIQPASSCPIPPGYEGGGGGAGAGGGMGIAIAGAAAVAALFLFAR